MQIIKNIADADITRYRAEAMEIARRRMQEKLNADAEIFKENELIVSTFLG